MIMSRLGRFKNLISDFASGYSNLGKWNHYYRDQHEIRLYDDERTYIMAAEFFKDVDVVEDWGCGGGGFRKYCASDYIGLDGSKAPFVDRVVDLCSYRNRADGILIRHVLEHNYKWKLILLNAVQSFQRKLCIVIFTPFGPRTRVLRYNSEFRVPDISFSKMDIVRCFKGCQWSLDENLSTNTEYGVEHIFYIERG